MGAKNDSRKQSVSAPAANVPIPKDEAEANEFIEYIGVAQRERTRIETQMNDELAELKAKFEEWAGEHTDSIERNLKGLQIWCEAHRAELLKGDSKTARFAAGEVSWRMRPSKVTLRSIKKVLDQLHEKELTRFIRSKETINKEAMLAEPDAVKDIKGVKVGSAGEKFIVKPFESELEEVA